MLLENKIVETLTCMGFPVDDMTLCLCSFKDSNSKQHFLYFKQMIKKYAVIKTIITLFEKMQNKKLTRDYIGIKNN